MKQLTVNAKGGADGAGNVNSVTFTLPSLPPSTNKIYEPGYSIYSNKPEWKIGGQWRIWQTNAAKYVPRFLIAPTSIVRVDRFYYCSWFYLNGNWRKMDVANMDKILFDTVARKIEIDDCMFRCGYMGSRDDPDNPRVKVKLTEITEQQWREWQ